MARPRLPPARVPTPGPWLVRVEAEASATPEAAMGGVEPTSEDRPGGFPYLIRQDRPLEPGDTDLHLAIGIQRLADAELMAAAPDLAAALLALLTTSGLTCRDLDPITREAVAAGWSLLVRVAPHLEI